MTYPPHDVDALKRQMDQIRFLATESVQAIVQRRDATLAELRQDEQRRDAVVAAVRLEEQRLTSLAEERRMADASLQVMRSQMERLTQELEMLGSALGMSLLPDQPTSQPEPPTWLPEPRPATRDYAPLAFSTATRVPEPIQPLPFAVPGYTAGLEPAPASEPRAEVVPSVVIERVWPVDPVAPAAQRMLAPEPAPKPAAAASMEPAATVVSSPVIEPAPAMPLAPAPAPVVAPLSEPPAAVVPAVLIEPAPLPPVAAAPVLIEPAPLPPVAAAPVLIEPAPLPPVVVPGPAAVPVVPATPTEPPALAEVLVTSQHPWAPAAAAAAAPSQSQTITDVLRALGRRPIVRHAATALLSVLLVGLALLLTPVSQIFGWELFAVQSGSMEPAIHVGGIVAVHPVPAEQLKVGDVITFVDQNRPDTFITHRIIEMSIKDGQATAKTKGDANDAADAWTVPTNRAVGRVDMALPYLGYLMVWLGSPLAKVGILALAVLGLALPSVGRRNQQAAVAAQQLAASVAVPAGYTLMPTMPVQPQQPAAVAPPVAPVAVQPVAPVAPPAVVPPAPQSASDPGFDALQAELQRMLGKAA